MQLRMSVSRTPTQDQVLQSHTPYKIKPGICSHGPTLWKASCYTALMGRT